MAPEVIQGKSHYGRKADIWSVGAVVIEMATGKPPFFDLPPLTALFKVGTTDVLPEIPSHLSDEAKDFLHCCFKRDPNSRPSARDLLNHPFISKKVENIRISQGLSIDDLPPMNNNNNSHNNNENNSKNLLDDFYRGGNDDDSILWNSENDSINSVISYLKQSTLDVQSLDYDQSVDWNKKSNGDSD